MNGLSGMGRAELEAELLRTQKELRQAYDNLTATQMRCTTLIQELRAYKAHQPLEGYRLSAETTSSHKAHRAGNREELFREPMALQRVQMACFGLAGESGETVDYLKKVIFHGHDLDLVKVKKEIGDVLWYVAELCSSLKLSLQDVADGNIQKLRARYGEQFSSERSRNREEGDA